MCGDLALSRRAAEQVLNQQWIPAELRFGVDFLLATVAITHHWEIVPLATRRRNKLRSFSTGPHGEYRMGAKFAEVAIAVQHRAGLRTHRPPPDTFTTTNTAAPASDGGAVPDHDTDIAELAASTGRRLRQDADAFAVFPGPLARRLALHARETAEHGLNWPDWRDCLFSWIRDHQSPPHAAIPTELFETLFLNRVVGHHREIVGTTTWYDTVRDQALDTFTHRHALWVSA